MGSEDAGGFIQAEGQVFYTKGAAGEKAQAQKSGRLESPDKYGGGSSSLISVSSMKDLWVRDVVGDSERLESATGARSQRALHGSWKSWDFM